MMKMPGVYEGIYKREAPFGKRVLGCLGVRGWQLGAALHSTGHKQGHNRATHSVPLDDDIYAQRLTPNVVVFFNHDWASASCL